MKDLGRKGFAGLERLSPSIAARLSAHRQLERVGIPREDGRAGDLMLPEIVIGNAGIDLHEEEQLGRLESWRQYSWLYEELRADRSVNPAGGPTRIVNGWYQSPNAEVYASMIADFAPSAIVEVGVGYSTLLARHVIRRMGLATRVVAVDPQPRTSVEGAADTIVRSAVEEARWDADPFPPLDEPFMLFVDSSHVTRAGGDIPTLFNQVIPRLAEGSVVHVDDVFIPWDYPSAYRRRLYTEQYVLQALLAGSDRFHTLFAGHYMSRRHTDAMAKIVNPNVGVRGQYFGSSYWFEVR